MLNLLKRMLTYFRLEFAEYLLPAGFEVIPIDVDDAEWGDVEDVVEQPTTEKVTE